jgi:hypothetical protein
MATKHSTPPDRIGKHGRAPVSPEVRFWRHVAKRDNGCWEWAGATWSGYGIFCTNRKDIRWTMGAHRFSYELAHGAIPDGLFVCHRCDNRGCVNPDHLFLGTNSENLMDASRKGRIASGDRNGLRVHPESALKGEANGFARLTLAAVLAIRAERLAGRPYHKIASRYGISTSQVFNVCQRKQWRHVA